MFSKSILFTSYLFVDKKLFTSLKKKMELKIKLLNFYYFKSLFVRIKIIIINYIKYEIYKENVYFIKSYKKIF